MSLYTKCIKEKILPEDGYRISIMSRHTLNDGITPDQEITHDLFNSHQTIFAPPLKLIGAYYRQEINWEQFSEKYLEYIRKNYMVPEVRTLAREALRKDITLLCIESTPKKCHRRLLTEECKLLIPKLGVVIL